MLKEALYFQKIHFIKIEIYIDRLSMCILVSAASVKQSILDLETLEKKDTKLPLKSMSVFTWGTLLRKSLGIL